MAKAPSRVCFIASGPIEWGSARMRCYWPARFMEGAVVINAQTPSQELPEADVYIWQKVIHPEAMAGLRKEGKLTFWDCCDPMWWFSPKEAREAADAVNAVVASSQALADDFSAWYGQEKVHVIPDRLELEHFPLTRQYVKRQEPVRFIWYGIQVNRIALFAAIANLERLAANGVQLALTIMDERPDLPWQFTQAFPVYYVKWELDRENGIIAAHDIALIPPYPGPWGKVKSNNRELTAWACGLLATDGQDYDSLYDLATSYSARYKRSRGLREQVRNEYPSWKSAEDWSKVIDAQRNSKSD